MRLLSLAAIALAAVTLPSTETPIELGLVQWERSFPAAQKIAKSVDKPVLLLFQEVPG